MLNCSKIVNNSDKERFEAIADWFALIIKSVAEDELELNDNIWFVLWIILLVNDNILWENVISGADNDNIGVIWGWLLGKEWFACDNNDRMAMKIIDIDNKLVNG